MNCVTVELVEAYASLFVSCWQYYAVQQRDGSYRPAYHPLTLPRLVDHLMGRYTLGTYVLDAEGCCSFAVFDADGGDGLERLMLLAGELAGQGIASVIEASRRGGHLWIFLDQPTSARVVRLWLVPYAVAYEVELYPKQDVLRPGGVGSLVRLPLGVHRVSGGWYPFLVPASNGLLLSAGETVTDCCVWVLRSAQRVEVPGEYRQLGQLPDGQNGEVGVSGSICSFEHVGIREWCRVQDITAVIGRYTCLDRSGVGRCPLPGHHYRGDVRPSLQVFSGDDPHWYCYTWGRAGNVFDFLCLYYGLSVQEAFERLEQGSLS